MLTDPLGHRVPDPSATRYYDNQELEGEDDDSTTPPHHQQAAEAAVNVGSEQPGKRERWMLSQTWRHGLAGSSIVCDPPSGFSDRHHDSIEYYGGLCVLESCSPSVRDHIIDLHNIDQRDERKLLRLQTLEDEANFVQFLFDLMDDPTKESVAKEVYCRLVGSSVRDFDESRQRMKKLIAEVCPEFMHPGDA